MTFTQSIKTCFAKYVDFSGRASRSEFWWWHLFACLLLMLGSFLIVFTFGMEPPSEGMGFADLSLATRGALFAVAFIFLSTFLPTIAVMVRRLHDVNFSGWWVFAGYFIMIVSTTVIGIGNFSEFEDGATEGMEIFLSYAPYISFVLNVLHFVVITPVAICILKKGDIGDNRFGSDPLAELDIKSP